MLSDPGAIICMPEMRNGILASATVLSTFAFALSFALVLVTGNWPRARVKWRGGAGATALLITELGTGDAWPRGT